MNDPFWFIPPSVELTAEEVEVLRKISPKARKLVEQNELLRKHYLELWRFKADFSRFADEHGWVKFGGGPIA